MATEDNHSGTHQRLLEAAGEVFAEHGFREATVRDICSRAGANVAAVNYHFGDKEGLYAALLQFAFDQSVRKYPPTLGLTDGATPEQRLHAFVRSFLFRIFDSGRMAWHEKLMAREIANPTKAFDAVIEQSVKPMFGILAAIVTDLLPAGANPLAIRLCSTSVVGQVLHYFFARSVITRLNPQLTFSEESLDMLAAHITRFSLAAIRNYAVPEATA